MFSKRAEVCHDQTIGNSFRFFLFSSLVHSPHLPIKSTEHIGYRSVCAWKMKKMNMQLMQSQRSGVANDKNNTVGGRSERM